jgi:hypothetical protein
VNNKKGEVMKKFICLTLLAVFCLFAESAYSATNIYKDTYTTEDSSGNWTFSGTVGSKAPITVIQTAAATTSTVTAAKSGYTFIVHPVGSGVGGNGWILTLPATTTGLKYTFVSATGTVLSVRPANTYSKIILPTNTLDSGDAVTSTLAVTATPVSISVICSGSEWYVVESSGRWNDGGAI